jgi:hypothetical protein
MIALADECGLLSAEWQTLPLLAELHESCGELTKWGRGRELLGIIEFQFC